MSESESDTVRFVGGIRTQTPFNATWPLGMLELTRGGVNIRPRSIARAVLVDDEYLWSEISKVEEVRGLVLGRGVRFDTARGPFVFWSFHPADVLASIDRFAPRGLMRQQGSRPRRIWLRP